jgi:hypothetical protein
MQRALAYILLLVVVSGCSPVSYYFKERIVERNAPARRAEHVDRFQMGVATGTVDVLFVVDNTRWMDGGLTPMPGTGVSKFQETYTRFVSSLSADPRTRQIDYRVQVVTTPQSRFPYNDAKRGKEHQSQFNELFSGGRNSLLSPERSPERGALSPFASTLTGLNTAPFVGRSFQPIYIVYVIGGDATTLSTLETDGAARAALLASYTQLRHFETSRTWVLSKQGNGRFPHCSDFYTAPVFERALSGLPWRSRGASNLCDADWNNWNTALLRSIVDTKSRLILTHPAFEPETMTVYAAGQLLRPTDHFTFDAQQNEIKILPIAGVRPGDLVTVNYFREPVTPETSGETTPPGGTVPGKKP